LAILLGNIVSEYEKRFCLLEIGRDELGTVC
jgi:hypothetical protein